jgi:hypothetical protein
MTARRAVARTNQTTISAGRRLTQLNDHTWAVVAPCAPRGHYRIVSIHESQSAALRTLAKRQ